MNRTHFAEEWNCCSAAAAATEATPAAHAPRMAATHRMESARQTWNGICQNVYNIDMLRAMNILPANTEIYFLRWQCGASSFYYMRAGETFDQRSPNSALIWARDAAIKCWCRIKRMDCMRVLEGAKCAQTNVHGASVYCSNIYYLFKWLLCCCRLLADYYLGRAIESAHRWAAPLGLLIFSARH